MEPEIILAGTASLFLALGDKTRLRLLNLMRGREICVSSFTGTLGHSQPLISRHLAYLRTSGIVEARRDGKWMHYRISTKLDDNSSKLLSGLFEWMEDQDGLRADREKYREAYPASQPDVRTKEKSTPSRKPRAPKKEPVYEAIDKVPESYIESIYEERYEPPVRHNELEDFLL